MKTRSKEEGLKEAREIIALSIKKTFSDLTLDEKTEEKLIEESLNNLKENKDSIFVAKPASESNKVSTKVPSASVMINR